MGSFAIINAYTTRICLSMAITKMVKPMGTMSNRSSHNTCAVSLSLPMYTYSGGGRMYDWDEYTQVIAVVITPQ